MTSSEEPAAGRKLQFGGTSLHSTGAFIRGRNEATERVLNPSEEVVEEEEQHRH